VHNSAYYIYFSSLHVSGDHVPIIRRCYCIYETLEFVTLNRWRLICWLEWNSTSRPDATHTEWEIPVSHRYSNFSWWWAHRRPKHLDKRNKYTKQNLGPISVYLQESNVIPLRKILNYSIVLDTAKRISVPVLACKIPLLLW